jgi:hypothetical protein
MAKATVSHRTAMDSAMAMVNAHGIVLPLPVVVTSQTSAPDERSGPWVGS